MFNLYVTSPKHEIAEVMTILNKHFNDYIIFPAATIKRGDSLDTAIIQIQEPFIGNLLKNKVIPELEDNIKYSKIRMNQVKDLS